MPGSRFRSCRRNKGYFLSGPYLCKYFSRAWLPRYSFTLHFVHDGRQSQTPRDNASPHFRYFWVLPPYLSLNSRDRPAPLAYLLLHSAITQANPNDGKSLPNALVVAGTNPLHLHGKITRRLRSHFIFAHNTHLRVAGIPPVPLILPFYLSLGHCAPLENEVLAVIKIRVPGSWLSQPSVPPLSLVAFGQLVN